MAPQKEQYTSTPLSQPIGPVGLAVFIVGPGLVAWLIAEDTLVGLLAGCGGLVAAAIVRSVIVHLSAKKSFAEAKAHLLARGFKTDLEFPRQFAIDSSIKKIAFVSPVTMTYEIYDMNDILGCEHQWVNTSGTNGRVEREKNILIFKTRNPHQPLYKFKVLSHAAAELWLARINALLNS